MLVAPVLAIMAWFAVDYVVSERPHAAKPGETYTLVAKSGCRYDSGQCDLENGDFRITLRPAASTASDVSLELVSRFPLQAAMIGIVETGDEKEPTRFESTDPEATRWSGSLDRPRSADSKLRVAVVAGDATYYAEVPIVFLKLED